MLARLRGYAEERAKEDRLRWGGRARRVESSLEGKARNTIIADNDVSLFGGSQGDVSVA